MSWLSQIENVASAKSAETDKAQKSEKRAFYGKTVGNPKLSESAQKYYEELKNKFSGMEFILVSADKKEEAQAQAARYARQDKTVVLIDDEKIERMASDESYRKQYEAILANAQAMTIQMQKELPSTGQNIRGFGIQVNDNGTLSYFAVIDKSLAAQRERIEEKAEQKRAEARKEAKKQREEKLEEAREKLKSEDTVTITATSLEELIKKLTDYTYEDMSNNVLTEAELQVGQHFDIKM